MSLLQNHRLLARPGLQKDFRDRYKNFPTVYTQWCKVGTTDSPEVSAATIVGPNRLIQSGEMNPVIYQQVTTGPKRMAVDKTYKGGYFLPKEAIDDDQYGKLNQGAKWLAEAARYTQEYAAAALMNDAFTGTFFKGMDALPLYSTAHTLIGSTATVSNTLSTALSLSVAGLTGLMDLARKCKNENGDPIVVMPSVLKIGNDQAQINKAYQILESELEPFTANNQDNPIRRNFKPTSVIVDPFVTSVYHYHVMDPSINDVQFLMKEAVSMKDWYDEEVDAAKVKARFRLLLWFFNWRGWYGTNPSA